MKAPTMLKEALLLALAQQEQIEQQQARLLQQGQALAALDSNAAAKRTGREREGQYKLAYLFEEGMCDFLSLGKTYAYQALRDDLVITYTVGRRRYVTHEALLAFRDHLQRQQCNAGPGPAVTA